MYPVNKSGTWDGCECLTGICCRTMTSELISCSLGNTLSSKQTDFPPGIGMKFC